MQAANLTAYWYTPTSEKKKKQATRFKIKPLSASKMYEVTDDCDHVGEEIHPRKNARELLWSEGIVDWENLKIGKEMIAFKAESFDAIPFPWLSELTIEIFKASTLTGEARKN